jgi:hypothetical protein
VRTWLSRFGSGMISVWTELGQCWVTSKHRLGDLNLHNVALDYDDDDVRGGELAEPNWGHEEDM